ncbi:6-phosphogluconate dehydrogenase, NAD(+)-dependent, decarboxylating [Bacillus sp. T2.9-1]|uniref:phosphogluconate dehydrogenase (NAD(+)-dependent, decarboxylating) n=1 Tax=Bacillus sp. T2.9-1 TaxID=3041163 RepID=UPI0024778816|nr:decarboxylating 6-phosphogluconate dehydrogenase [Bacillus sp. T2.9-1]CAI9395170.1 6-phosphogluconate dehydrogenase, NAD(+)-dependent, decarboxylating [Bacillus sp. T2.9-1]
MQIGMIGLGKMGYNLALNLANNHHSVYGFDQSNEARIRAKENGIHIAESMDQLLLNMPSPRVVWVMVPAGKPSEMVIEELFEKMKADDIVIDGGNANYKDSIRRAALADEKGIHFLDVGTSGGILGANEGACLMIGGKREIFELVEPIFNSISIQDGYLHAGESGSGHFLKMVHNGIEYGFMQAIGEGFQVLNQSQYDFDLAKIASVWNNGSVIRSWLMELMVSAFQKDTRLENIRGMVASSGEAKWTIETALDLEVPVPIIALSLMMRNRTLEEDSFSAKVVAALRNEFGGHSVIRK